MSDMISRQAAIDALAKAMPSLTTPDGCGQFDHDIYIAQETFVDSMQIIADLPCAERRGRWDKTGETRYYVDMRYADYEYKCSCCGNRKWSAEIPQYNYCPNCGALMEASE